MSDDPHKKQQDARTVSRQPWEIDYAVNVLRVKFPDRTADEVRRAVQDAKKEVEPSEDRQKVMERAASKLG